MSIQSEGFLFELVQLLGLFPDSKTFPDAPACSEDKDIQKAVDALISKYAPLFGATLAKPTETESMLAAVQLLHELKWELQRLVKVHFKVSDQNQGATPHSDSMENHIERMWN